MIKNIICKLFKLIRKEKYNEKLDSLSKHILDLNDKHEKEQKQNKDTIQKLKAELSSLENTYSTLSKKYEEKSALLLEKNNELTNENGVLNQELSDLLEQQNIFRHSYELLEIEKEELTTEVRSLNDELEELKIANDSLKKEILKDEERVEHYIKDFQNERNNNEFQKREIEVLRRHNSQLKDFISEKEASIIELEKKISAVKNDKEVVKEKQSELASLLVKGHEYAKQLFHEKELLTSNIEQLRTENKELKQEINVIISESCSIKETYQKTINKLEEEKISAVASDSKLKEENSILKTLLENKEKENDELKNRIQKHENLLIQKSNTQIISKGDFIVEKQWLIKELEEYLRENEDLKNIHKISDFLKDKRITDLQYEVKNLRVKIRKLEEANVKNRQIEQKTIFLIEYPSSPTQKKEINLKNSNKLIVLNGKLYFNFISENTMLDKAYDSLIFIQKSIYITQYKNKKGILYCMGNMVECLRESIYDDIQYIKGKFKLTNKGMLNEVISISELVKCLGRHI